LVPHAGGPALWALRWVDLRNATDIPWLGWPDRLEAIRGRRHIPKRPRHPDGGAEWGGRGDGKGGRICGPDPSAMEHPMIIPGYGEWTGPHRTDCEPGTTDHLLAPVPGARWPYGPPPRHEAGCGLHTGGLFCDCAASSTDDAEWGVST